MKTPLRLLLMLIAVVLIAPAVIATDSPAQAEKEMKTPPPPPPSGVSPANADIDPPVMGPWRCPQCGAENPRMGKKARFNRPMLAPRDRGTCDTPGAGHAFNKPGRGRGSCDMPRGGRAFNKSGKGRRGHGDRDMRGQRGGHAAMRLVMHAEQLGLSTEQVAQLEKLAYDTKAQLIDMKAALAKEKLEMQQLMRSESDDLTAIKRHLKSMADMRVDMQTAKIAVKIKAKSILTDDQKELLKKQFPRMGRNCNQR
jgi:Spy/CpxP family protein refolding chaperone